MEQAGEPLAPISQQPQMSSGKSQTMKREDEEENGAARKMTMETKAIRSKM
jgi:hypothetical protein